MLEYWENSRVLLENSVPAPVIYCDFWMNFVIVLLMGKFLFIYQRYVSDFLKLVQNFSCHLHSPLLFRLASLKQNDGKVYCTIFSQVTKFMLPIICIHRKLKKATGIFQLYQVPKILKRGHGYVSQGRTCLQGGN